MQGKQIQQINLTAKGKNSVTLKSADLGAGMYLYSLIMDGQEIQTMRMIIADK